MMVAARSISECAASDRIASDPVSTPTTPLPSVMAADAAIEVSATVSLMFRIDVLSPATGSEAGHGRQCANASILLVHRHILRHGNANDWQVRDPCPPLFGGADDGMDGPALPVLPSSAHAPGSDLYRNDHHRRGVARRSRAAPSLRCGRT